jgi:hypothetical protein
MTKQSPNIIEVIRFLRSARNDYNGHFSEVSNYNLNFLNLIFFKIISAFTPKIFIVTYYLYKI